MLPLASKLGNAQNKIWVGVLLSSLLFALTHLVNLTHQALLITLLQILSAFSIGILLSAIYLRTGSILFSFLVHGSQDFIATYTNGGTSINKVTSLDLLPVVIFIISGIWMLRKSQRVNIKQPIRE
ncbi:CPBP family intramembrane metalloprotease [Lactobacillus bombi]|nr:CPBP family intramembrane metalloprotease [Bombilactobacillus bombi]